MIQEPSFKKKVPKQPLYEKETSDEVVNEMWQDTSELTFLDTLETGDLAFIRYNTHNLSLFKMMQLKFIRFITGRCYDDISIIYRKASTNRDMSDVLFILSPCINMSEWAMQVKSHSELKIDESVRDVNESKNETNAHYMSRIASHPGFLKSELKSILKIDTECKGWSSYFHIPKFTRLKKQPGLYSFEYLHLLVYQDPELVTIRRIVCDKNDRLRIENALKNTIKTNKHVRSLWSDVCNCLFRKPLNGFYTRHYIESLKEKIEILHGNRIIDNSKHVFIEKLLKTLKISEANSIIDSLIDLERASDKCHSLSFNHYKIIALFENQRNMTHAETINHCDSTLAVKVFSDAGIMCSGVKFTQEDLMDFVPLNSSATVPSQYMDGSINNPLAAVVPRLSASFDLHDGYMQHARRVAQTYTPLHSIIKVPS